MQKWAMASIAPTFALFQGMSIYGTMLPILGVAPAANLYNFTSGFLLPRNRGLQHFGPYTNTSFGELGFKEGKTASVQFGFSCTNDGSWTGQTIVQLIRLAMPWPMTSCELMVLCKAKFLPSALKYNCSRWWARDQGKGRGQEQSARAGTRWQGRRKAIPRWVQQQQTRVPRRYLRPARNSTSTRGPTKSCVYRRHVLSGGILRDGGRKALERTATMPNGWDVSRLPLCTVFTAGAVSHPTPPHPNTPLPAERQSFPKVPPSQSERHPLPQLVHCHRSDTIFALLSPSTGQHLILPPWGAPVGPVTRRSGCNSWRVPDAY